jgi:hypothetical protein
MGGCPDDKEAEHTAMAHTISKAQSHDLLKPFVPSSSCLLGSLFSMLASMSMADQADGVLVLQFRGRSARKSRYGVHHT